MDYIVIGNALLFVAIAGTWFVYKFRESDRKSKEIIELAEEAASLPSS